ncbi:cytochrome P450 [Suillus paluster]|uniref:cytochrome P450 n=1 Tax=Suillus paluster TaxID=48578 RepID=UPI001B85B4B7|nr:cytochrome P450 [Suillus paluster]KAG1728983.1 cytochrome P450 [Suillus paluster]
MMNFLLEPFLPRLLPATLQLHNLCISDNPQLVLGAAACLGVIVGAIAWAYLPKKKSGLPLPPSPPTWRLLGHMLPHRNTFLTVAGWIHKYGPVITIRLGYVNIVIIGRYKAAIDIMENQGKSLADRPRMVAAGEIFSGGLSIAFAPFGERFRCMRRALHTHLQPKAAEAYQPLQMSHAKNTVLDILDDPHNFENHVKTYAAAIIMKIAYGKNTPTSATDPEVIETNELFRMVGAIARPGAYLVDSIPWLKYLPWYGRDLRRGFERNMKLNAGHMNRVKEQMQSNVDIGPSFAKYMLESGHLYGLSEAETAFLAGALFRAGSNTTSVALCTVFMAAACFPEEQAKVQAELDAVIGSHRAPTFADQSSLPRLQAFISEALRWRPMAPGGLAHQTNKEVIWENYCIPAGTIVFGNHWSISRDPEVYPEPYAFKPQRWIDDQGRLRDDLKFFVYGFGRRVCPGQHVADRSVFINSLLILWSFRLALDPTQPLDDMGYINDDIPERPCAIEFEARIPETELRRMMQDHPEVALHEKS